MSGIQECQVSPRTSRCSKRSSAINKATPPSRAAASRRSRSSKIALYTDSSVVSWRYDDLAGHLLVPAAAEDAAVEIVGRRPLGHDPHARDLAGLDGLVDLEVRPLEAVLAIEGRQLEHHRPACLALDHAGPA